MQTELPAISGAVACRVKKWEPWSAAPGSSLVGHVTVSFHGWTINRIPIFSRADGGLSAGSPSAPEIDREGKVRTRPDGKRAYWQMVTFDDDTARDRWQRAILAALDAAGIRGGEVVE